MKKTKILLTGATGFLGSHLFNDLIKDYDVSILIRETSDFKKLKTCEQELEIYLIENVNFELLFQNNYFEIIIHTATSYGRKQESKEEIYKINYDLPKTLLELSTKNKVKYFINTDTFFNKEMGLANGLRHYVNSKKDFLDFSNKIVINKNIVFINLTIFQMYGPGDGKEKFTSYIINEFLINSKELNLTSCEQTRDFIYVLDVVNAIKHIIQFRFNLHDNFINFNIGSGIEVSLKEMVLKTRELCNSHTKLNFGNLKQRSGEIMNSVANNKSLLNIGWQPKYDLVDGLIQTIQSIKNNNN